MNELTSGEFFFIETEKMSEERKKLGYKVENKPSYVIQCFENGIVSKKASALINNADVLIVGNASEGLIKPRLKADQLTVYYSERIYKKGYGSIIKWPFRLVSFYRKYGKFKNSYILCASAYTARDYIINGCFVNKAYKWGYFPKDIRYKDIKTVINKKRKATILWVGRLIDWKHPEICIEIATRLRQDGLVFNIEIVGTGAMYEELQKRIANENLEEYVSLCGAVDSEEVRRKMESASIFLFTSDFNEGWGAVLNESMNSGCAVVASHAIGSVPFLIKHGQNGLIYENGNTDELYNNVIYLLENSEHAMRLGENAYYTITETWNATEGAKRLLMLFDDLDKSGQSNRYEEGPCSKAKVIKHNWYNGNRYK